MLRRRVIRLLFALVLLPVAVVAQDGTLDPSFGDGGVVMTGVGATFSHTPGGVTVQPDGKFVVAGWAWGTYSFSRLALARFDAEGALDSSFGEGGRVLVDEMGDVRAHAIARQPDGKLIVAGYARDGEYSSLALYRFTPDGLLDPTFGTSGRVFTSIGELSSAAHAVVLQSDGKIIAAGRSDLLNGFGSAIAVARYGADGTLDPSFGDGGVVVKRIGTDTSARYDDVFDVALDSAGRVVVAGSHEAADDRLSFVLLRFTSSGELDPTFGSDGIVTTSFGASDAAAFAVALLPDNRIVAAGYAGNLSSSGFALARYLTNGTLDSSFGSGGTVVTSLTPGRDVAEALSVQPSGLILVAGTAQAEGVSTAGLAQYLSDGSLDPSFGEGGVVFASETGGSALIISDAVIADGGRIATVGAMTNPNDFALRLYDADGTLDASFGEGGTTTVGNFRPGADFVRDLALQSDGRFMVLGEAESSSEATVSLLRFTEDGSRDSAFGSDGAVTLSYGPPTREYSRWGPQALTASEDGAVIAGFVPEVDEVEEDDPSMDFMLARFGSDGALDIDFGGGPFTTDLGADDRASAVLVQDDGKVIVGGTSGTFPAIGFFEGDLALVRYTPEGILDPSFGNEGIVLLDEASFEGITAAALLADGRILVAGYRDDEATPPEAFVARFLPDGTLDGTFATGGLAVVPPPTGYYLLIPNDVVLLADGQSVVASVAFASSGGRAFYLFSLNAEGSFVWERQEDALEATGVAVDSEGRVVAAGVGVGVAVTARYAPDGAPDPDFGDGGLVETDIERVGGPVRVIAHPSGRIIAASTVKTGGHTDIGLWALRNGIPVTAESTLVGGSITSSLTVWPNPTRRFATAAIVLGRPGKVKVEVLDVLGRRVAILHDGALSAGEHRFLFERGQLPSGFYLARVVGDGWSATQKLVLTE